MGHGRQKVVHMVLARAGLVNLHLLRLAVLLFLQIEIAQHQQSRKENQRNKPRRCHGEAMEGRLFFRKYQEFIAEHTTEFMGVIVECA